MAVVDPSAACADPAGLEITPASIGLATRGAVVESATLTPATAPAPEFCLVRGRIDSVDEHLALVYGWDRVLAAQAAGPITPAAQQLVLKATIDACDGLDGAADGVIADRSGCDDTFDTTTPACPKAQSATTALPRARSRR